MSKSSTSNKRSATKRSYSSNLDIASRQSASLVIEFGAAYIRVGIAGEPRPRHVFPLRRQEWEQNRNVDHEYGYWPSLPSLPCLIQPPESNSGGGSKSDDDASYNDLLPWFSNLYTYHLLLKPRSRRVIFILPIHHPPALKSSLESILLDHLQVPSVLFVDSFRTIPYAIAGGAEESESGPEESSHMNGTARGMIVDLGCVEGRIACFFNGDICEDTLQIVPIGFQSLLKGVVAEGMVPASEASSAPAPAPAPAPIDNVDVINEMYFDLNNPNSLIYAFFSSLIKCPIDLRKQVVQRVIFVGGGVEGVSQFEKRFVQCVQGLFELDADQDANVGTIYRVKNFKHRKFSSLANVVMKAPLGVLYPLQFRPSCVSWVGGSIMGSLKLTSENWVNRSQ